VIVSSDGTNGLCIEHSVAEGIVIINMAESAIRYVQEKLHNKQVAPATRLLQPKPLEWNVGSKEMELLEKLKRHFDDLAHDLDMQVMVFKEFGKNLPKANQISPDGFVQLAMQLAYFKLHGHLVSTYESAAIRRFRIGRVDNIRAATPEALAWVQSMASSGTSAV
uniref:Choline O-acetyltransferase n=1 Tax=Plectus sambesii TaxID=2011161 RepID=A0A914V3D5_9BILA